jgi:hypothetical protein
LNPSLLQKPTVLKQCSKFYASRGNVAKLKRITGLPIKYSTNNYIMFLAIVNEVHLLY